MTRYLLIAVPAVAFIVPLSCSSGGKVAEPSNLAPQRIAAPTSQAGEQADEIKADPIAFLREVLARTERLDHYRLTFYRQERLGKKLREMEHIRALFRQQPFSVKFVWDSADVDYYESVYVAGENDNKLIVRERKGALPLLPPTTRKIDPMFAVEFGRARNPVTEFGLAKLARRTYEPLVDPATRDDMTVAYMGIVNLTPQGRPAHHLRIERKPMPEYQYARQDFYVDTQTLLPAGTDLYLPGGELDARYRYADIDPAAELTDADFRVR